MFRSGIDALEKRVYQALAAVALHMPITEADMKTHLIGHIPNHIRNNGESQSKAVACGIAQLVNLAALCKHRKQSECLSALCG